MTEVLRRKIPSQNQHKEEVSNKGNLIDPQQAALAI